MSESPSPVLLQLRDGELVSADAVWLSVLRGRVWVTRANDPDDHFLESGQAMRLPRGSGALIGAEGQAQLMLLAAPSWFTRLPGRLAMALQASVRAMKTGTLGAR